MPRYRVTWWVGTLEATVEADDEEDAERIAEEEMLDNLNGGQGSWEVVVLDE